MNDSRFQNVKRNFIYSSLSNFILLAFAFINRTVFIRFLSVDYLGVNGLLSNVIGILAFSELGIGTIITYSLYKPIAENDERKITALMNLYKTAYRIIALVVVIIGLSFLPFFRFIVHTEISFKNIYTAYFVYVANILISYLLTYKTTFATAAQKNYIVVNFDTAGKIVTYILQIVALYISHSFIVYLLVQLFVGLIAKIFLVRYLNKKFPVLKIATNEKVDDETKRTLRKNVKAAIFHNIGGVCVHQTDNIIISTFISTAVVGLISNYTMLVSVVNVFVNSLFGAFTSSIGNLIAQESAEKKRQIFDIYIFIGFWISSFIAVCLIVLSKPFITLWLGKDFLVDNVSMILYYVAIYFQIICLPVHNYKIAAGIFVDDQFLSFTQAVVNLAVSIIFVKLIGLAGVYVGTIVQRMLVVVVWPIIVNKKVLERNCTSYFAKLVLNTLICSVVTFSLFVFSEHYMTKPSLVRFCMLVGLCLLVPNIVYFIIFHRTQTFKSLLQYAKTGRRK